MMLTEQKNSVHKLELFRAHIPHALHVTFCVPLHCDVMTLTCIELENAQLKEQICIMQY